MEVENGNVQELQQLTKAVRQTNQPIETQEEIVSEKWINTSFWKVISIFIIFQDIAQDIHLDISEDSVKDHNVSLILLL